jgi:hypothetical protein
MTHNVPVQSLIDHIKTAIDVDPWAMEMAEDLLKKQEAVEPKTEPSAKGYWYTCGVCGWWLFEVRDTVHFDGRKRIRYCASCGQAVKWE